MRATVVGVLLSQKQLVHRSGPARAQAPVLRWTHSRQQQAPGAQLEGVLEAAWVMHQWERQGLRWGRWWQLMPSCQMMTRWLSPMASLLAAVDWPQVTHVSLRW